MEAGMKGAMLCACRERNCIGYFGWVTCESSCPRVLHETTNVSTVVVHTVDLTKELGACYSRDLLNVTINLISVCFASAL